MDATSATALALLSLAALWAIYQGAALVLERRRPGLPPQAGCRRARAAVAWSAVGLGLLLLSFGAPVVCYYFDLWPGLVCFALGAPVASMVSMFALGLALRALRFEEAGRTCHVALVLSLVAVALSAFPATLGVGLMLHPPM